MDATTKPHQRQAVFMSDTCLDFDLHITMKIADLFQLDLLLYK